MHAAVDSLSTTSASFLTSSSPLKSMSAPPAFKPYTISPIKAESRYSGLFHHTPRTAQEAELLEALQESENRDMGCKRSMLEMQALTVVAGIYNSKAQSQLQAAEQRKRHKTGSRKMGDGKAKYFSGDAFFEMCEADEQKKLDEAVEKERRLAEREVQTGRIWTWQDANKVIRSRNVDRRAKYAVGVTAWKVEKTAAKVEKCWTGWLKPKLADYEIEALLPRPKKKHTRRAGRGRGEQRPWVPKWK
ncbi:hypothetical protein DFH08DRAFT_694672 [Mycena albidolilacea]|uniref:Uncharacterized protein n=1 Tax=Mycena albidolilacea TaxID=1033008 RepID=A0AAD7ETU3_9AGAR|nr:hypothetical protein DFH08DRAFT_694672 [Mycena albidolilacea]